MVNRIAIKISQSGMDWIRSYDDYLSNMIGFQRALNTGKHGVILHPRKKNMFRENKKAASRKVATCSLMMMIMVMIVIAKMLFVFDKVRDSYITNN